MKVFTSGGCPDPATGYYARLRGHGFPATGVVVSTPTDAGMSRVGGFYVYFRDTLRDYAHDAAATLHGRYEITVYCVDDLDTHYAEYTGALLFSTPTRYTAIGTARPGPNAAPVAASPVPAHALVLSQPSNPPATGSAQAAAGGRGSSTGSLLYVSLGIAVIVVLVVAFKYGQRSALRAAAPDRRTAAVPASPRSRR